MRIINIMKGNKLLTVTFLFYFFLFIIIPERAHESVSNSSYYIREMLQIMPVVFILTSLLEAWIPKETIVKGFGANSGIRGNVLSLLLGSISAGPIYAAFPVCKMLFKKGASTTNIVIILSAWAVIKVPMLANEAKFLGVKFMSLRWLLTVISILAMAYLIPLLVKKDGITLAEKETQSNLKEVVVEDKYCIGCGICARLMPEHFKMRDKKAIHKKGSITNNNIGDYNDILLKCPSKAISLK
jgi:uncharacterized membrane protein YraQ (UPF0718 family)